MRQEKKLQYIEYQPNSQREFVKKFTSKKLVKKRDKKRQKPATVTKNKQTLVKESKVAETTLKKRIQTIEDNGTITKIEVQQLSL